MNADLCSFTITRSKLAFGLIVVCCLIILTTLKYAQINPWAKIVLVGIVISSSCILVYNLEFKTIYGKYDILYHLNNLIISNKQQVIMYDIVSWYSIANLCVIITIKQANQQRNLLLFRDSCPQSVFNELMRNIRWKPINNT